MKRLKNIVYISLFMIQFTGNFFAIECSRTNNDKTIQAYEQKIESYINNTPQVVSGDIKEWIDTIVSYVHSGGYILEIGSAFGRDADYIESKGYIVNRSDAAHSFVSYLQERGHSAQCINILTDSLDGSYDMIFANAVFLHFSPVELNHVFEKLYNHLHPSGILAFSVKKGIGEEWSNQKLGIDRYFYYWMSLDLSRLLINNNFNILQIDETDIWIRVIVQKIIN